MIQQPNFQVFSQRKLNQHVKQISALLCLFHCYSQYSRYRINLKIHKQANDINAFMQTGNIIPVSFDYLLQHGKPTGILLRKINQLLKDRYSCCQFYVKTKKVDLFRSKEQNTVFQGLWFQWRSTWENGGQQVPKTPIDMFKRSVLQQDDYN